MGDTIHSTVEEDSKFVDFLTDFDVEFVSLVDHGSNRLPFKIVRDDEERAKWTTKYINSLPNSSFAVIETGYKNDESSKSARHLPFKDAGGTVDLPHLRNALARANQIKSVLGNDTDGELRARAQRKLAPYAKKYLNKRGELGMNDVIQSVLVPSTSDIENMKEKLTWLHDMEVQRVDEFDYYKKFNHRPVDSFKPESFYMERLEGGALALVGELLEPDQKAVTVRGNTMSAAVGIDSNGFVTTFGDIIYRELDSLVTNVISTLSMSSLDSKSKKKAVASALSAFSTYVSMGLDNSGDSIALRIERSPLDSLKKTEEVVEMEEVIEKTEVIAVDPSEQLIKLVDERIPEAINKALEARLETVVTEIMERLAPKKEEVVEEVRTEESIEVTPAVDVEALQNQIKELEQRLAKFEEEDVSISRIAEDKEPVVRKDIEADSVFKGLFLKNFSLA